MEVEGGGWRVEGGGWRVEGGGWRVEGGGWRVALHLLQNRPADAATDGVWAVENDNFGDAGGCGYRHNIPQRPARDLQRGLGFCS